MYSLIRYCKTTKDPLVRSLALLLPFITSSLSLLSPTTPSIPYCLRFLTASAQINAYLIISHLRHHPHPYLMSTHLQVPSVWGPVARNEDPYAATGAAGKGCCVVQ